MKKKKPPLSMDLLAVSQPLILHPTPQENCTSCGSPDVQWVNQFCQECWEHYTSDQWSGMIQNSTPHESMGIIDTNSVSEDEL